MGKLQPHLVTHSASMLQSQIIDFFLKSDRENEPIENRTTISSSSVFSVAKIQKNRR